MYPAPEPAWGALEGLRTPVPVVPAAGEATGDTKTGGRFGGNLEALPRRLVLTFPQVTLPDLGTGR